MAGMEMVYGDTKFQFWKMRNSQTPFMLRYIIHKGQDINIGRNRKLILRGNHELDKIDSFQGLADISLVYVDLREEGRLLERMSFDSLTVWPGPEKLPKNFDPKRLLEEGKNPGLGIRGLHKQGVDGRGVGVAIIDQPLLLGHSEYTARIVRYDATGLSQMPPQMHGSPVASIAIGKNIGVAPRAALSYFAVPTWKQNNQIYIQAVKRIFELNKIVPPEEKIRVISISTGMFSHYDGFDEWQEVLKRAETQGILVITCDRAQLPYGTLKLLPGSDPDQPESYAGGPYRWTDDVLRIPTTNKATASHRGVDVYTYDSRGGMSWAAPYIAGLAALAFQVEPEITPSRIKELLIQTAVQTDAGPVVHPSGFISAVRQSK